MGKRNEYMTDDGARKKMLTPLEAEKREKKKREQRKLEDERRKKKFKEMLKNEPEVLKRKVLALEKQDKLGKLSVRQMNEKREMRNLLAEHEKEHGEVKLTQRKDGDAAAAEAASEGGAEEVDAEATVEMKWNPTAVKAMVPTALRRRVVTAQTKAPVKSEVIATSGLTAHDVSAAMLPQPAPAAAPGPAAPPAPATSGLSVNLTPDVDEDAADAEYAEFLRSLK